MTRQNVGIKPIFQPTHRDLENIYLDICREYLFYFRENPTWLLAVEKICRKVI